LLPFPKPAARSFGCSADFQPSGGKLTGAAWRKGVSPFHGKQLSNESFDELIVPIAVSDIATRHPRNFILCRPRSTKSTSPMVERAQIMTDDAKKESKNRREERCESS
jgi:hypothetical protein